MHCPQPQRRGHDCSSSISGVAVIGPRSRVHLRHCVAWSSDTVLAYDACFDSLAAYTPSFTSPAAFLCSVTS